jgi:hypothetical protein
LWSEHLWGRDNLEKLGVDGSIIVKCILKKYRALGIIKFIWLRVGMGGGLVRTRKLTLVLGKYLIN